MVLRQRPTRTMCVCLWHKHEKHQDGVFPLCKCSRAELRGLFLGRSPDAAVQHHSLTNENFTLFAVWRPRQEMNLALDCNHLQLRNP